MHIHEPWPDFVSNCVWEVEGDEKNEKSGNLGNQKTIR